ncbi:DUF192 domain-containing protein [bacterium]|nr:DUF192 domain-containing protein [bacterium]
MNTKTNKKPGTKRRFPSPLIIIGLTVIALTIIFLLISNYLMDHRDPEITRVIKQEREQPAHEAIQFRNDAMLYFTEAEGDTLTSIAVEIAEDENTRTQGLMGREHMGEQQGMLFIFPNEEYRSFWMANTPLPLDIIFVNSAGSIVTIQRNTIPYSEESVPSTAPATYVVEVNAGFCDRHGVREGNFVRWIREEM